MHDSQTTFRWITWVALGVTVVTLFLLCTQALAMALFCIVSGALIGFASVATVPQRPLALYVAFGLFMGYGFWMGVSSINRRDFLDLIVIVILEAGVVWLLKQPSWPAMGFTGLAGLLLIVLMLVQVRQRHNLVGIDPDLVRRSALTGVTILGLGLLNAGLGFAESWVHRPSGAKRRRARQRVEEAEEV